MSKLANLFISTIIVLSTFSCKKDYSCFCKVAVTTQGGFYQDKTINYQMVTKNTAQKDCQKEEASLNSWQDSSINSADSTYSCAIK